MYTFDLPCFYFLAFVVCFEQLVLGFVSIVSYILPARTSSTQAQRQRAKLLANEAIQDLEMER